MTVTDSRGGKGTQPVDLAVSDVAANTAPTITFAPPSPATAGRAYQYQITGSDADGDALTYALDWGPPGMTVDPNTGLLTWTPPLADAGQSFTVETSVLDSRGARTAAQPVNLAVQADVAVANQPPTIGSTPPPGPVAVGYTYQYQVKASDPDGDPITYYLPVAPKGMSIDALTGLLTWTPDSSFTGSLPVPVEVEALDNRGGVSQPQQFQLAVEPASSGASPTIDTTALPGPAVVGSDWQYQFLAHDPDGDKLSYSLDSTSTAAGLVIDANTGMMTWRPTSVVSLSPVVTVTDRGVGTASPTYGLASVSSASDNGSPVFSSTPPVGPAVVGLPFTYQAAATDSDGEKVTYSVDGASAALGVTIDANTGLLKWTPTATNSGLTIVVTARDRTHQVSQNVPLNAPLTVVAGPAEHAPVITTTQADLPGPAVVGFAWQAPIKATDADGDPISYYLSGAPAGMTIDRTTGLVAWTPGASGAFNFTVVAADNRGGLAVSPVYSVSVNSTPGTDMPSVTTTALGGPAVALVPWQQQIKGHDPAGSPLTYSISGQPPGMQLDPQTGLLSWTPRTDQVNTQQNPNYSFQVTVTNGFGFVSTPANFSLVVNAGAVNGSPSIVRNAPTAVQAGRDYVYAVQASDDDGDPLTWSLPLMKPTGTNPMTITAGGVIQWQTTAADVGSHQVAVAVSDGRGGYDTYGFTINIGSQAAVDHPPQITSTPKLNATLGQVYAYDMTGIDPDGDLLSWSVEKGPYGMAIDPLTGALRWTPTRDELGKQDVIVKLTDQYGESFTQPFTITARAENLPPMINSSANTAAVTGALYTYAVRATDPEGGPLKYALDAASLARGMKIDANSGLVQWTPATDGAYPVTITVTDDQGASMLQPYSITSSSTSKNTAPTITATPPATAIAEVDYHTVITAGDGDGDTITYGLSQTPTPVAADNSDLMTIDPATGVLDWIPSAAQVDYAQAHGGLQWVTITATDNGSPALTASYRYAISMRAADPGATFGAPLTTVTAGLPYAYDVQASDSDGDALSYALANSPKGMTIDPFGRVRWATTAADAGSYVVDVAATDSFGVTRDQKFTLSVQADLQAPTIDLEVSPNPADKNAPVSVLALAADNVGVASVTLTDTTGGVTTNVPLDSHGGATLKYAAYGTHTLTETATDLSGNVSPPQTVTLVIKALNDPQAPALAITSPTGTTDANGFLQNPVIMAPTNVVGTVSDPALKSYVLEAISADTGSVHVFASVASTNGQPLPNITNAVIGQFDPTLLANGSYDLRLTATNFNDLTATVDQEVNVSGHLKLGNFTLAFTDLTVPVAGIPITITRSYDTLNADKSADFGYGWTLGIEQAKISVDLATTALPAFGDLPAFVDGTRVTVTRPDGTTEGFTFQPVVGSADPLGLLPVWHPQFIPDAGVTDRLTVPDVQLQRLDDGTYFTYDFGGLSYNPANPNFGGAYTIISPDGTSRKVDANTGKVVSISDRHGNTLAISDAGITSNRGRSVTFERDQLGRITKITDPAGGSLTYQYDPSGNLTAFYDRNATAALATAPNTPPTARFDYRSDKQHFMNHAYDALGRTTATTVYNADPKTGVVDDRIDALTDAQGKSIGFAYDLATNPQAPTETFTDQAGNPSTITFDARGNVTRQSQPDGSQTDITKTVYGDPNHPDLMTSQTQVVGLEDSASSEHNDLTTTYSYAAGDRLGNVQVKTDPSGNKTLYGYNEAGQLESTTDALGNTTQNLYDFSGENAPGNLLATVDPQGNATFFQYDSAGDPTEIATGESNSPFLDYDLLNNGYLDNNYGAGSGSGAGSDSTGGSGGGVDPAWEPMTRPTLAKTTLDYFPTGDLQQTATPTGVARTFGYDQLGDRTSSSQTVVVNGISYQIVDGTSYDADGRESGTTKTRITSPGAPNQTSQTLSTTTTTYTASGQVETTKDQLQNETDTAYDSRGQVIQTRREAHDENGNVQWLVTRTVYDDAGRASVTTDEYQEGTSAPIWGTRNTYDAAGNVIKTERLKGVQIAFNGTPDAYVSTLTSAGTVISTTTTSYDTIGRAAASTDEYGRQTLNTYDAAGNEVETRTQNYDQNGTLVWRVTRTVYDKYGRAVTATDPFLISADGLETVLTPVIMGTQTVYDQQGRAIETDRLQGVSVALSNGETSVASAGTVISTSKTTYNSKGQVQETTDSAGRTIDYEYDNFGRQTATVDAPLAPADVGLTGYAAGTMVRLRSETAYDAQGRVETKTTNIREIVAADGTVTTDRSAARQAAFGYDELGNLVQTTLPDPDGGGPLASPTTSTGYDALGRKTSETNQMGKTRTFSYDADGRLASVALPAVPDPLNANAQTNPTYQYGYDAFGRQTLIRDPYGRQTQFTFDERGNQLSRTLPLGVEHGGFAETFQYDDLGRQTLHVSFEGAVTQSVYDPQTGRLSQKLFFDNLTDYNNGAGTPSQTWTYKYDAFDRVVSVTQSGGTNAGTTTTTYDAQGRVLSIGSPQGVINYEYDAATGLKKRTYTTDPNNPLTVLDDTHYSYDVMGRLQTVMLEMQNGTAVSPAQTTTDKYDLLGNLREQDDPNGGIVDYLYNDLDQLTQKIDYAPDGTTKLAEYDYTLEADGKRTAATETIWWNVGGANTPHVNNLTWTYDADGRLTDEVMASYDSTLSYADHFTLDLVGNQRSETKNWTNKPHETITSAFDDNDRLLTSTDTPASGVATTTTYGYGAGNVGTQETGETVATGGVTTRSETLGYDLQGRLSVVTIETFNPTTGALASNQRTTYGYDSSGNRVSALLQTDTNLDGAYDTSVLTQFLNDPQNPTGYSQVLRQTTTDQTTSPPQIQKVVVYTVGATLISQTTTPYASGVAGTPQTLVFGYDGHGNRSRGVLTRNRWSKQYQNSRVFRGK